ncbi:hypothetical protein ACWOC1_06105 [Enterococcus quebecensis]|uniref:Uncharacterized protein n=1 Tax=Enterococcus quebecensis TaxID=903983 RepID=A0A1E5GXA3_9ENTE|nr:hypothetical protein [Enterococcus quebecensis]OEG17303.1 hypothetical protein BCR23_04680 [Enterococcus quebecensis]OJG72036.1 hypothetical protein RV12_GL001119 [Enterococcus quebecensis]
MDQKLNFIASLILLAYPVLSIPSLFKSKQEKGKYFAESHFFIPKRIGYGIGINMHNIYGFFIFLSIGLLLLFLSF